MFITTAYKFRFEYPNIKNATQITQSEAQENTLVLMEQSALIWETYTVWLKSPFQFPSCYKLLSHPV